MIVQTRAYRAPEVALVYGWTLVADMWSYGAIVCEMVLGHELFPNAQTLENIFSMYEVLFGRVPDKMLQPMHRKYFNEYGELLERKMPASSLNHVIESHSLSMLLRSHDHTLKDFILGLLQVDPDNRMTAQQALTHSFLRLR